VESNETYRATLSERAGTLVCFAVKEEAAEFKKKNLSALNAEILLTGIGTRNAAEALYPVLEKRRFSLVLTCGFAGALNPDFKIGEVFFEEDCEPKLAEALRATGARPAKFHCAKRVAITVAEKAELRRTTGADVVEMESAMIRQICRERKVRSATVRVISDTANEDLPLDFNALMTADYQLSSMKLTMALMKSPGAVPRLMELQRNTQVGAQRLAEVLESLLRTLNGSGSAGGLGVLV
jgi:adenosylhomocysteine nucleosidase